MSGENTYGQKTMVKLILASSSRTVVEHSPNHLRVKRLIKSWAADGTAREKMLKICFFKSTK
jgi:hypothetical protein